MINNINSATNSIPATLNDLLVKLKILSMIERGKKINMGSMSFTDSNSWLGALTRSLSGEGRKGLMLHLNQIVQQAISAINEYQTTEFCVLVVNHLSQAKIGIQNLTTTYQSDPSIVAQLEVCLSNIDLQLDKNLSLLEGHKPQIIQIPHKKDFISFGGDQVSKKNMIQSTFEYNNTHKNIHNKRDHVNFEEPNSKQPILKEINSTNNT
jgi:hypothetical protein